MPQSTPDSACWKYWHPGSLIKAPNEWKQFIFFLCKLSKWQLLILHHFSAKSLSRWQKIVVRGGFLSVVWEKVSQVQMMLLISVELLLFYFRVHQK